jgi:hypothetical protein
MIGLGLKERGVDAVQSGDACTRVIGAMSSPAGFAGVETWSIVSALAIEPIVSSKTNASKVGLSFIRDLLGRCSWMRATPLQSPLL